MQKRLMAVWKEGEWKLGVRKIKLQKLGIQLMIPEDMRRGVESSRWLVKTFSAHLKHDLESFHY